MRVAAVHSVEDVFGCAASFVLEPRVVQLFLTTHHNGSTKLDVELPDWNLSLTDDHVVLVATALTALVQKTCPTIHNN